ncbi:MAG TPA: SGNH/GDSL hydrolase family protein [Fimbriimonadaceae bacterium]|nr:SGNH/GDSL hydrolase family protein [Fimbriimonadaceae bacterium]
MIPFLLPLALAQGPGGFALSDGDRVLFYGDSITDNQYYPQFVENYVVTRFPNLHVTFMNYGWSGDKVGGGGGGDIEKRLSRDVFPFHPTVVTIMLGMNDGGYRAWDDNLATTYETGYQHILDALKAHGRPRITLIKPSPYDDITAPSTGYNQVLIRYGDWLGGLAPKVGASVTDFNAPMDDMLTKAKEIDPEAARKLIPDRIHPSAPAHVVMADALLKTWNAPSMVSATQIDASGAVSTTDNATVRDLKTKGGVLSWRELEGALPVYLDKSSPMLALVLRCSTVFEDLDQEPLKVTNLAAGTYKLSIDDEEMGRFTAEQLSAGVNLADLNTPMMKQAAAVGVWTARRQYLRQTMWRAIVVPTDGWGLSQRDQAVRSLERLESDVVDHQHQAAKPVWHTFKVEKAEPRVSGKGRVKGF